MPEDDAGSLHDKLMLEGAKLLVKTIEGLAKQTLQEMPQDKIATSDLKHAPKIFKQHLLLDWNQSVNHLQLMVRGMSPYPAVFTMLDGKQLKIYRSHIIHEDHKVSFGAYETDHHTFLRFAAKDGWLYADEVQLEGKKRMEITAFLRGFRG